MAAQRRSYEDLVRVAANKYGVPQNLVQNVLLKESAGNPYARSNKGAIGLMQLMPNTAAMYGVNSQQLYDPATNIDVGTHYLADQYHRTGNNPIGALVSYNGGPGRWDAITRGKSSYSMLPSETQNYVNDIMGNINGNRMPAIPNINTASDNLRVTPAINNSNQAVSMIQQGSYIPGLQEAYQAPVFRPVSMQPYNDNVDSLINAINNRFNNAIQPVSSTAF